MPETNGKSIRWIIGTLIVIVGVVFTYLFNAYNRTEASVDGYRIQVDEIKAYVSDLKTDIGSIKTDIGWIKEALKKTNIK